jgi:hypothetical protein
VVGLVFFVVLGFVGVMMRRVMGLGFYVMQ